MPLTANKIDRVFIWKGTKLPDPAPAADINAVRDILAHTYPEIANAAVDDKLEGTTHTFTFVASVGEKG